MKKYKKKKQKTKKNKKLQNIKTVYFDSRKPSNRIYTISDPKNTPTPSFFQKV